jgi:3-oxoacyl-[acyl-carrier protein] reductase
VIPTSYSAPETIASTRAIVAGAASGIGRAVAQRLARGGASVTFADLDAAGAAAAAAASEGAGGAVAHVAVDIGDVAAVGAMVDGHRRRFGAIDAVVNCVGITGETGKPSHEIPLADFERVLGVNLRAAFVLSQAVLRFMLEQGYGRLLHVASIAGKEGNAGMVSYSASKAGLIGMVKTMGKEYGPEGVTVNALAPAVIMTPLVEAMPAHQVAYMTEKIPMGRLGTLDEAAAMAEFIVSPQASFCTGFAFDLSGGRATY